MDPTRHLRWNQVEVVRGGAQEDMKVGVYNIGRVKTDLWNGEGGGCETHARHPNGAVRPTIGYGSLGFGE